MLLGGRRGTIAMRVEGRPYTTIERVLVTRLVEVILHDARKAFDPLTAVDFELDRIETNPRFAAIAQPANAAILVKLRIDMEDRGGRCELLLPYATLEPIRKMLLQNFMGEKFGRDNIWEGHLATELWSAPTTLRVVLDEFTQPLGKMMNLAGRRHADHERHAGVEGAPDVRRHPSHPRPGRPHRPESGDARRGADHERCEETRSGGTMTIPTGIYSTRPGSLPRRPADDRHRSTACASTAS